MAAHNQFGREGEEQACRYLTDRGYSLLERNWRVGHLELDIVADYYGELVFVEVKARRSEEFSPAETAVSQAKRENLIKAARAFQKTFGTDQPIRFDIITVVGEQPPFRISHIPYAFNAESVLTERFHGPAT